MFHRYNMTITTPPPKDYLKKKMRAEPSIQLMKSDLELRIFHKSLALINLIHFEDSILTCVKLMTTFGWKLNGRFLKMRVVFTLLVMITMTI